MAMPEPAQDQPGTRSPRKTRPRNMIQTGSVARISAAVDAGSHWIPTVTGSM